jgi:NAD(P)-dependent dehydrogenase (short-subunit alcohol dehydrogenase family)
MNEKIAFVTGADRGLGLAMCAGLLQKGWRVFAGRYLPDWPELDQLAVRFRDRLTAVPLDVGSIESAREAARQVRAQARHVDVLINNAGIISRFEDIPISSPQNDSEMQRQFDINALGPLRMVEAFFDLVSNSEIRRLCFVSSEASSIATSRRTAWFGYCMSKTALNISVKNLFNDLRPKGFTFRLYHPGWMRSYMSGEKNLKATYEPEEAAVPALAYFLSGLENELPGIDEDRLVLRDNLGKEYPW